MASIGLRHPLPHETSWTNCIDFGKIADASGVDTLWVGESWRTSSVPLLTQLAAATATTDVCAGVFNVFSRTPSVIAMNAASLATVADGRVRIGLGTSGPAVVENFHGVEFHRPLRRTREYIEIIRAFLSGDRVDYDGEMFDLAGFGIDAPETNLPIYVAAMGETNLELTGAFANGWIPLLVPKSALSEALTHVERGAESRDRTLSDIDVAPWIPTCISESDPDLARDHARSLIGFYVGAMGDFYANTVKRFGYSEEADEIQAGWNDDGTDGAAAAIPREMLEDFAACGTPDDAAASLDEYRSQGADMPVAYIPAHWADDDTIEETIRALA